MLKSLLKLLLLGGLAAGASGLPGLLGGLPALADGKAPAALLPSGSDENSAELRREMADLGSSVANLKELAAGGAPVNAPEGLSAAEREMMKDAAPKLNFKSNPLTRGLGLAGKGAPAGGLPALPGGTGEVLRRLKDSEGPDFQSFSDFRAGLLNFYRRHQAAAAWVLWLGPAAAVGLSFLLFLFKRYTLSMLLTGLLFTLATFLLWALSASVVLSSVLTGRSLLPALPRELWLSPVVFLVVSAGLLRLADENYPFWNRTVSSLFTPIAASLAAAFWPLGVKYAKGLAAARGIGA